MPPLTVPVADPLSHLIVPPLLVAIPPIIIPTLKIQGALALTHVIFPPLIVEIPSVIV